MIHTVRSVTVWSRQPVSFQYDPDSSFRSLRKLFTSSGVKNMQKWLASNWYIPVSATVGFIIMLVSEDIRAQISCPFCIQLSVPFMLVFEDVHPVSAAFTRSLFTSMCRYCWSNSVYQRRNPTRRRRRKKIRKITRRKITRSGRCSGSEGRPKRVKRFHLTLNTNQAFYTYQKAVRTWNLKCQTG